MEEQPKIVININGGTTMIMPAATSAIQNFYNDRFTEQAGPEKQLVRLESSLSQQERNLYKYVHDVEKMSIYISLLGDCNTAHELAQVVGNMLDDGFVEKHTVVKAAFIQVLLPFATNLTSGGKVDNVRQQINNMLAARRRKEKAAV